MIVAIVEFSLLVFFTSLFLKIMLGSSPPKSKQEAQTGDKHIPSAL
jgi:hypothetical protein